ncbi:MAG: linked oxidase-like protein [Candidatus Eremiobacteraeota bacterium]|nr:linked oxidase-like protein [Candidatus Eremiobacteraeota bacterium]
MTGSFAVAGVTPRDVVTPATIDELAEIVRGLHADRKAFAFIGGGTELELGNAPRALDTVVRTSALDRVIEYAPEDQTITLEAGVTLAELDRVLGAHGQMLPIDVADRDQATVGGIIATGAYGRRRLRYGTVKDLIVGVGIVRPDGVRARGGGKVVKNVAGFDLPKLMVGALGTLGAIVTATLRVYPVPASVRAVVLHFDGAAGVASAVAVLVEQRFEPESVVVYNYGALVVTFAGTAGGVDAQIAAMLGAVAAASGCVNAAELSDLERESYEQRERAVRRDGDWRVRIVAPPAYPVTTLGSFAASPPLAVPVAYPLLGIALHAHAAADAPPERHLTDLRDNVSAQTRGTGAVIAHAIPAVARPHVDAWPKLPPAQFATMRAMKNNFDPHGLCNPGRFIGGL